MLYMERRSNRILTNLRSSKLAVTVRAADDVQKNLVQSASSVNLEQIAWKTIACRIPDSINPGSRISLLDLFILIYYKLLSQVFNQFGDSNGTDFGQDNGKFEA